MIRGAFGAAPVVVAARGADLLATLGMLAGDRTARLEITRFGLVY